jgi:predicted CoA-binding protein
MMAATPFQEEQADAEQRGVPPMDKMKDVATEFLTHKRVAVTGVSRKPQGHGSNIVYKRLRDRGYTGFAVNPNADRIDG